MIREFLVWMICRLKGHEHGPLYRWRSSGFRVIPGCLRCKSEFDKEKA